MEEAGTEDVLKAIIAVGVRFGAMEYISKDAVISGIISGVIEYYFMSTSLLLQDYSVVMQPTFVGDK